MKKIIVLIFCFLWLISCGQDKQVNTEKQDMSTTNSEQIASIWVAEFKQKISDDFILIDIRTPGEISRWAIPGMDMSMDFYSSDIKQKVEALDKDKKYLIYCNSWNRTWSMLYFMRESWFKEAYDLDWGIQAWMMAWEEVE